MATGPASRFASQLALVVSTVFASACVATADGPSPTESHGATTTVVPPTTTTTVTKEQGLVDFRECMSGLGVDIDEIELDGRGRPQMARALSHLDFDDRLAIEAIDECAAELVGGALDLTSDPQLRELVIRSLGEFAECVRGRGVPEFPDPVPTFSGVGAPFPGALIPWDDDDLAEAVTVCSRELGWS